MASEDVSQMNFADTPVSVIKEAMEAFVFVCFMADAIEQGRINPSTFRDQIRIDDGGKGLGIKKHFTADEMVGLGRNNRLMALGTTAIATETAMHAVLGQIEPADTSPLGSARAIIYQIRCAVAHDLLNPVWRPNPARYNHTYRITVNVPGESGETTPRTLTIDPISLTDKPSQWR